MLIGFTDSYSIGAQNGYFSNIAYEDGFYAQDEWRASSRLTLQLGLRYDLLTRPYEAQNRQASFDVNTADSTYGQVLVANQKRCLAVNHQQRLHEPGTAHRICL